MLSDPIVALATPPGRSALALVRLSGDRRVRGRRPGDRRVPQQPPRAGHAGHLPRCRPASRSTAASTPCSPAPAAIPAKIWSSSPATAAFRSPARLLAALQAAGARPAAPGEFTRRAVLNGKLDLVQAEAVGDLIDATAPAQAQAALHQLEGGLSRRLATLRESLLEIAGACSATTSTFPRRTTARYRPSGSRAQIEDARATRSRLPGGHAPRRPSGCGKARCWCLPGGPMPASPRSSTRCSAAPATLVTEIPGTTRDAVEAHTDFLGWPVRLADTAGLVGCTRPRSTGWASR